MRSDCSSGPLPQVWELMFDTVDGAWDCMRIATGVLSTLKIRPDRMLKGVFLMSM